MSTTHFSTRPDPSEYPEWNETYVSKTPPGNVIDTLRSQIAEINSLFSQMTDEQASYRYQPDKWSLKQLIGHMSDTERIFAHRALRFARSDETPLPGFDDKGYVDAANFDARSLADLMTELVLVRRTTISFFGSLDEVRWKLSGEANGFRYSVGATAWVIAGHMEHHFRVIKARYAEALVGTK